MGWSRERERGGLTVGGRDRNLPGPKEENRIGCRQAQTWRKHEHCRISSTLKMEATHFSLSSTYFFRSRRRKMPVIYVLFESEVLWETHSPLLFVLILNLWRKARCTLWFVLNIQKTWSWTACKGKSSRVWEFGGYLTVCVKAYHVTKCHEGNKKKRISSTLGNIYSHIAEVKSKNSRE